MMTRCATTTFILIYALVFFMGCDSEKTGSGNSEKPSTESLSFRVEQGQYEATISVFREGSSEPVLVQNVQEDFRPYLHPIKSPDGQSVLTEYSPGHHKHQTGLYWGFTRVNGRDYFHNPEGDYWQKVSAEVLQAEGESVKWQTQYHLLDEAGEPLLEETQTWSMQQQGDHYLLDLEWQGKALQEVTIGEYDYGGLFLRMPWQEGMPAEVVNAARQRDEKAEGQRAMWLDVGMRVEGRDDFAHIAIFDHPDNEGFPQTWRVDGQFGVGPARARMGDWSIPKGETEMIKHQLVVYTGELNDVELTDMWEEYQGGASMYSTAAMWRIAQEEGRQAKFLTPEEAVESMTIQEGFEVNVWASEPMMSQPMAFCWDDKGRLWIAENLDYESRGSGFSNNGQSRILILEDTDKDGKADKRKVFLEGIAFPSALAVGFDGVFIGAPPNLLFVPDRDGDDKADMDDVEVRLTGWGIRDRHETLNSFHWGPDGWLYGLQGFATPSKVRKPQGKGKLYRHNDPFPEDILEGEGTDINGGVWRYHPTKEIFEVVAHGFSNPWGIDYDAKGQLFMSACVIPHLWHIVLGGIYHRQGGQHFNPYVYNDIKTIADHRHRSAHGGARIYLSDAFPEEHHGRLFMANIHEHAVLSDVLERKGSGFTASHGDDFLMANNAQWVGFSMEIGPEGALYVLDWHDADICGQEVLNSETGRIFRITPKNSQAENWAGRYADLSVMSDAELVNLQHSPSAWHARRARLILQNRAYQGKLAETTHRQLREISQNAKSTDIRLRAMWALQVTGGFDDNQLMAALDDQDEYVRAWAIQLLCEDQNPADEAIRKFEQMAEDDPSPVVRLYLVSALQRIKQSQKWAIAEALMQQGDDADDHNLPKMIWYGTEPLVAENPERALAMAAESKIPMLAEFIARRAVDADASEELIVQLGKSPATLAHMLKGMRDGQEGRSDLTTPENWPSVYARLQKVKQPEVEQLALEIAQQFGDTEAAKQYLATLKNTSAPLADRKKAIQALAAQQREELLPEIPRLFDETDLRTEAIRAVAAYDHKPLGEMLLNKYNQLNDVNQLEAIQSLASRPDYGWMLTQAMKRGDIPKSEVPAYVARQLRRVVGSGFVEVWGPIDEMSGDLVAAYDKYHKLLTDEALLSANTANGRVLFQRSCGPCHQMYGEGGQIGPDLTGSNRTNVDYILSNVLNPDGEIQDDYKMLVVTTRDGRTYTGNLVGENERQITIRTIGQESLQISKAEIQARETTENSLMPAGLFETLSEQEVLDLVAYLRSAEQVSEAQSD